MGWSREIVLKVARRTGYPVVEAWSGHNQGQMGVIYGPMLHHTGSSRSAAGDYPTLRVVRDGRSDLKNSLCMYGLGRSGTIYCINEKVSWHSGAGNWNGVTDGNGHFAGIEAESDGSVASWSAAQLDSYAKLCASILQETGRDINWMPRHADYALPRGRKVDTSGMDYGALKAKVSSLLKGPDLVVPAKISYPVYGSINAKATKLNIVDKASAAEIKLKDGWTQGFGPGISIWAKAGLPEAYAVQGGILDAYKRVGYENSAMGYPVTDEHPTGDGRGRISRFERGMALGTAKTGSFAVQGALATRYEKLGVEKSILGFPVRDELAVKGGWMQGFENGSLYYQAGTPQAYVVRGGIGKAWASHGYEQGFLGWPVEDEVPVTDGADILGWSQRFTGGTIFYKNDGKDKGYYLVGGILDKYVALGGPRSPLGWPTTNDLADSAGGAFVNFERGAINWHPRTNLAVASWGPAFDVWSFGDYSRSRYTGYPLEEPKQHEDGSWSQKFEKSTIYVDSDGGWKIED